MKKKMMKDVKDMTMLTWLPLYWLSKYLRPKIVPNKNAARPNSPLMQQNMRLSRYLEL